ncbi:hypothetical protein OROGR_010309 [Orobanche gracilis]
MASLKQLLLIISLSTLSDVIQTQTPPPTPQSIINAAETLASSGHTAMSLTLQLIAPTLPLPSVASTITLTIFSPSNAAFSSFGQPSLPHLLLHFSPLSLSPSSLLSLPFSSTIPSLSPSKHLVITSDEPNEISINNVRISEPPIFDDGLVIVYAIDSFFNLNFTLTNANSTKANPRSDFQCLNLEAVSKFEEASGALKLRGYSIVASFLDLQLVGYFGRSDDIMKWTVFAPVDSELVKLISGDFLSYSSLFMRHFAPCKLGWNDLEKMVNGTVISNNVNGFSLSVTRNEDDEIVMVNGVQITFPDMYENEWLVIHGIRGVIALPTEIAADGEMDFP